MCRSTHTQLLQVRKTVLDRFINKFITRNEAAKLLGMHPNAVSRLKKRYEELGDCALIGSKSGPKNGHCANRTPEDREQLVEKLAIERPDLGPLPLSEEIKEKFGFTIHPTTIWRIIKRRKVRYTTEYKRLKKEVKLYCLDEPGIEIQLDGCYPYGRSRKIVCYDAIDDCSRFVFGKCYAGAESDELAIQYISELVDKVPFRIQKIRVDNRYGKKFEKFCNSISIEVHRNDPYKPQQNGKIERFHGTSKREFFHKIPWNILLDELNYQFRLWLYDYNHKRKHGGYGMNRLTPVEKLMESYTDLTLRYIETYPIQNVTGIMQQHIF
jgi:transposase InsO family protein